MLVLSREAFYMYSTLLLSSYFFFLHCCLLICLAENLSILYCCGSLQFYNAFSWQIATGTEYAIVSYVSLPFSVMCCCRNLSSLFLFSKFHWPDQLLCTQSAAPLEDLIKYGSMRLVTHMTVCCLRKGTQGVYTTCLLSLPLSRYLHPISSFPGQPYFSWAVFCFW